MYLVAERFEERDMAALSRLDRVKMILINVYIVLMIFFDLLWVKKSAFETGDINLTGLYILLTYFLLIEGYGFYKYYSELEHSERRSNKQISYWGTLFSHGSSLLKIVLYGFCLFNDKNQLIPNYFAIRFTIYGSTFFEILNQLRLIRYFVLRKNDINNFLLKYGMWQLDNFQKIFQLGLIGATLDVVSFGYSRNYYIFIAGIISWAIYQFNRTMSKNLGWKFLKNIFQSQ